MGEYFTYVLSTAIMMQTSICRLEHSRRSRYSTTTRPFHLHNELSKTLVGTSMLIHYRLPPNWHLFARLWSSHLFGQQRASCSVRHSQVVHILHRYAIFGQGESPFSERAVQFIQKANENARPRSVRGPECSPRQVRELIGRTL